MGYRSDVGYVIRFQDIDNMKKFVGLHSINDHTREALNECEVCLEECELHYHADDVKWYDSFEEVQAHEFLLESLDEEGAPEAGYRFVRIGENDDDNEQKYGGNNDLIPWDAIGISRAIAWDTGKTVKAEGTNTIAIVYEA